ncbi:hypothetical protein NECID01_1534 [Nematocida sp. AWRm77]|nr:hypothetical protein NECID01_1534 [Nematocida sp. AWRm77]
MNRENEELQRRKNTFKAFIGRDPDTNPTGKKKEAIEKVFFFSDEQFNEICEDLLEEIARRETKETAPLAFGPKYTHKRNIVREQLSLLELADMQSLVEDTLLVLMHKHPESAEDRLECLTKLVEDLQQIVASNTPQSSPATLMRSVERTRLAIEKEKDALSKTEVLLEALAESTEDLSPSTHELFSMIRQSIAEEKKNLKNIAPISPELYAALLATCNAHNREDYAKKMKAHSDLQEPLLKDRMQQQTVIDEFILLCNAKALLPSSPQERPKDEEEAPSALEKAVCRVTNAFEEIEFAFRNNKSFAQIERSTEQLFKEKPGLIKALQAEKRRTKALEALPAIPEVRTEKDAMSSAKTLYMALLSSLS